jgi:PAP2 superfamily
MKFRTRPEWAVGAVSIVAGWLALAVPAQADIVTDWSAVASDVVRQISGPGGAIPGSTSESERSPAYGMDMATFHIALYDTIVAFKGGYDSFAAAPDKVRKGASMEAAANEAAYTVLGKLFPGKSATYLPVYNSKMAALVAQGVSAKSIEDGRAVGLDVATQILALRSADGRLTPLPPFANPTSPLPGQYISVNPATVVGRNNAFIRPFTMSSASQFRPKAPPKLNSFRYARDFWETKTWGGADATSPRDAGQDNLAKFLTGPPPAFWTRNLIQFADYSRPIENARFLAAMWVAHADATIGCFEAKYYHLAWRPFTAIPAGDSDGNGLTVGDPAWTPNEPTPNHPEYPSGHSCISGASFGAIALLKGTTKIDFTLTETIPGLSPSSLTYHDTLDFIEDVMDGRVLGGMHFRYANEAGLELGSNVARQVLRYGFRKDRDDHDHGHGHGHDNDRRD